MYIFIVVLMIIFAIIESTRTYVSKSIMNVVLGVIFLILTAMVCFRYGQGTDYFGYKADYNGFPHGEWLWRLLEALFLKLRVEYEAWVFIIALSSMIFAYIAVKRFSPLPILSTLLMFPTIYLTYVFSGVRQGMVITMFLGLLLPLLIKDKYIQYYMVCMILIGIHSCAVVLLLLPTIKKVRISVIYVINIVMPFFSFVIIYVCTQTTIMDSLYKTTGVEIFYLIKYYMSEISISTVGIIERVMMMILITVLFEYGHKAVDNNDFKDILYKIYSFGFVIYCSLIEFSTVASRMSAVCKAVEIILIPLLLYSMIHYKKIIYYLLVGYVVLFTYKNINTTIAQGAYRDVNVFTYPYISIFNKEDIIYRKY